jgi:hypothetical protein
MKLTRHAIPTAFSGGICGEDAKKPRKVTMASKMHCFPNSLRLSPEVVPIQTMVIVLHSKPTNYLTDIQRSDNRETWAPG